VLVFESAFNMDGRDLRENLGPVLTLAIPGLVASTAVTGAVDGTIYQSERWGGSWQPDMHYAFPVDPGSHLVRLHFAEIYDGISASNPRVFSVAIEGVPLLENLDLFGTAGPFVAVVEEIHVEVTDTTLDIEFLRVLENPKVAGIEVFAVSQSGPELEVSPDPIDFGTTTLPAAPGPVTVMLTNIGDGVLNVSSVSITGADAADFATDALQAYTLQPSDSATFNVSFLSPGVAGDRAASLEVQSDGLAPLAQVPIAASLVDPGPPTLDVSPDPIDFGTTVAPASPSPRTCWPPSGERPDRLSDPALAGTRNPPPRSPSFRQGSPIRFPSHPHRPNGPEDQAELLRYLLPLLRQPYTP